MLQVGTILEKVKYIYEKNFFLILQNCTHLPDLCIGLVSNHFDYLTGDMIYLIRNVAWTDWCYILGRVRKIEMHVWKKIFFILKSHTHLTGLSIDLVLNLLVYLTKGRAYLVHKVAWMDATIKHSIIKTQM